MLVVFVNASEIIIELLVHFVDELKVMIGLRLAKENQQDAQDVGHKRTVSKVRLCELDDPEKRIERRVPITVEEAGGNLLVQPVLTKSRT